MGDPLFIVRLNFSTEKFSRCYKKARVYKSGQWTVNSEQLIVKK